MTPCCVYVIAQDGWCDKGSIVMAEWEKEVVGNAVICSVDQEFVESTAI